MCMETVFTTHGQLAGLTHSFKSYAVLAFDVDSFTEKMCPNVPPSHRCCPLLFDNDFEVSGCCAVNVDEFSVCFECNQLCIDIFVSIKCCIVKRSSLKPIFDVNIRIFWIRNVLVFSSSWTVPVQISAPRWLSNENAFFLTDPAFW